MLKIMKIIFTQNNYFRNTILIIVLYFINRFYKSYSSNTIILFYFSDFLAGLLATNIFQQFNFYLQTLDKKPIPDFILLILTFAFGFLWEYKSSLFFTNTTTDYIDIIAYIACPMYNFLNNKLGVTKWMGNFLK